MGAGAEEAECFVEVLLVLVTSILTSELDGATEELADQPS